MHLWNSGHMAHLGEGGEGRETNWLGYMATILVVISSPPGHPL